MSPIRAGGSLHCGARAGCTEPSTVLSPAGGAGDAQERLSSLTHAIRVSWLNAPTFCSAVNNSCSRAVGGIRFRLKGRTPISSSLNIHRLLFAGTMCGSNCKLKWSCVCWHLWIQNYHPGYLWGGGGGRLQKEKSGFLNLIPFLKLKCLAFLRQHCIPTGGKSYRYFNYILVQH